MAGGYSGNDGPVFMTLTIDGCSVTDSTITGKGSAGGIIGHGSCSAWTDVIIVNSTVSGNTITSTGSSNNKAGSVMGTIGAAGQPTTADGVTKTGGMSVSVTTADNTVKSADKVITTIYGRQGTPTGLLEIAGGTYEANPIEEGVSYAAPTEGCIIKQNDDGTYGVAADPAYGKVAKIGDTYYETLAEAIAAAQAGDTVELLADASVEGTAQIPAGVTIKSNGYKILGSIRMLGDLTLDGSLEITGGLWVGKAGETLAATLAGDKLTASYFMFQRGSYTIDADIDAVYGYLSFEGEFEVNSTITTSNTNGEPLYLRGQINLNEGASFIVKNLFLDNANTVLKVKKGASITAGSGVSLTTAGAQLYSSGDISGSISAIDGTTVSLTGGTYTQDVAEYCAKGYQSVKQPGEEQWQVGKLPNAEVVNMGPSTVTSADFGSGYWEFDLMTNAKEPNQTEPFDLQVVLNFIAKDSPEQAAESAYADYFTDFRIKIEGMTSGSIKADEDCYLAGYYAGMWVKVALTGFEIKNGVGYPVISPLFPFTYEMICSDVKDFICGIHLSEKVLNENPNLKVSLDLGMTETVEEMIEGGNFIQVGETYDYTADEMRGPVAISGPDYFTTVTGAVEAALVTGDFVKLVNNAVLEGDLELGGDLVINLGGKTLTAADKTLAIADSVVTITNGTLSGFSAANITLSGNAILTVTEESVAANFRTDADYYVSQNANGTHSIMLKSAFRVFITMVDGEPRIGFFKDCCSGSAPTYTLLGATSLENLAWKVVNYIDADDAAGASTLPLYWAKLDQAADDTKVYRFFKIGPAPAAE